MNLVFFGTPEFVVPIVESLHKSIKSSSSDSPIVAIVTQPPRNVGRKKIVTPSPVDNWGKKRGIPVLYTADDLVKSNIKAQIGVLAAYGEILRVEHLNHFPNGVINIHYSLLPKYRGASPVQASIVAGETRSGVTISKMDKNLDKGKLIFYIRDGIKNTDTTNSIRKRYSILTSKELPKILKAYVAGKINLKPLGEHKGTYSTVLKKDDAYIPSNYLRGALEGKTIREEWKIPFMSNFSLKPSAEVLEKFIRAMQPWPIAWTKIKVNEKELRLKILKSHLSNGNTLRLDIVQLEGKNPVSWDEFKLGHPKFRLT